MCKTRVFSHIVYSPSLLTQNDDTGLYSHLTGVPKALLPGIRGKKILDFWWETVKMCVKVANDPHINMSHNILMSHY